MNRVYLHSGIKENSLVKIILYLLIPFFLYGFYKNGIFLYRKGLVSLIMMFKPVYLLIISSIISLVFSLVKKKSFISYILLANIIISLIAMPNINILVYLIGLVLANIILCFIDYSSISLFMIIAYICSFIFKNYSFLNAFESSFEHQYSFVNYLFGKGPGGIGNTLFLFSIISLILLSLNYGYKKYIPLTSLIIYYSLLTIYSFISGNPSLDLFMNNNLVFATIFIAPFTLSSPYTKGGCYIYGIILGILSFIAIFANLDIGIYFIIFVLSLIYKVFDKMTYGKNR